MGCTWPGRAGSGVVPTVITRQVSEAERRHLGTVPSVTMMADALRPNSWSGHGQRRMDTLIRSGSGNVMPRPSVRHAEFSSRDRLPTIRSQHTLTSMLSGDSAGSENNGRKRATPTFAALRQASMGAGSGRGAGNAAGAELPLPSQPTLHVPLNVRLGTPAAGAVGSGAGAGEPTRGLPLTDTLRSRFRSASQRSMSSVGSDAGSVSSAYANSGMAGGIGASGCSPRQPELDDKRAVHVAGASMRSRGNGGGGAGRGGSPLPDGDTPRSRSGVLSGMRKWVSWSGRRPQAPKPRAPVERSASARSVRTGASSMRSTGLSHHGSSHSMRVDTHAKGRTSATPGNVVSPLHAVVGPPRVVKDSSTQLDAGGERGVFQRNSKHRNSGNSLFASARSWVSGTAASPASSFTNSVLTAGKAPASTTPMRLSP